MKARITESGCTSNRLVARTAIIEVLEGMTPFSITNMELDRLLHCGTCQRFRADSDSINFTEDRRSYNRDALDTSELNITCVHDVITYVNTCLTRNLLRIEKMNMNRGDKEVVRWERRMRRLGGKCGKCK